MTIRRADAGGKCMNAQSNKLEYVSATLMAALVLGPAMVPAFGGVSGMVKTNGSSSFSFFRGRHVPLGKMT